VRYSVVSSSEVMSHKDKRIDSEHYHPSHLRNLEKYMEKSKRLGDYILHMSGGATPLGAIYPESGIPFLRVENVMQNYISESNMVYITDEQHGSIARSELKENDILLTITGAFGKAAVVTARFEGANINQHSVKMTVDGISPHFLAAFLNCKYGFSQSTRHVVGITRPALDYSAVRSFYIPSLSDAFQNVVEHVCLQAETVRENRFSVYYEAQSMLLSELGLADWRPRHHLSFIKHYADLQEAERIDADYFQPKYDEIIDAIKACHGGWETLGDLVSLKKCIEVGRGEYLDEGIPFVRVSNLSPFEISKEKYISDSLYSDIKEHQPKRGEILLTKDATPGVAHYLKDAPEKMIPSGGILRLKTKSDGVNNEYLTLVLNSILTKEQVNRDVGGSVILHWLPKQVKGVVVPMLPLDKQTQIAQKVDEAFTLRKQSKRLLECAKRAVEIAIEKGERAAVEWLEREAG